MKKIINLIKKFFNKSKNEPILIVGEEELVKYLENMDERTKQFLKTADKKEKKQMERIFKTWADPNKDINHAKKSLTVADENKEESFDKLLKVEAEKEEQIKQQTENNPFKMIKKVQAIIDKISNGEKISIEVTNETQKILARITEMAIKCARKKIPNANYCKYELMYTPTCPKVSYSITAGITKETLQSKIPYFKVYDKEDTYIGCVIFGNSSIKAVLLNKIIIN